MPELPYMVWKGTDDTNLFQAYPNLISQFRPANLGQTSSKPALLSLPGTILMAYRGAGGDSSIYWNTWTPQGWSPRHSVPGVGTSWAPILVSWPGGALMAWPGIGNDTRIWCSVYTAATNSWSTPPQFRSNPGSTNTQFLTRLPSGGAIQSGSTPGLTNMGGNHLMMVWRGEGDNDSLYYATSTDGGHWVGNIPIRGAASTTPPAVASSNGIVRVLFKGGKNDTTIYQTEYYIAEIGPYWTQVAPAGPFGTSDGPSIAVFSSGVYIMTWKGVPGDSTNYFCQTILEGGNWQGQTVISYTGSSVGPGICVSPVPNNLA